MPKQRKHQKQSLITGWVNPNRQKAITKAKKSKISKNVTSKHSSMMASSRTQTARADGGEISGTEEKYTFFYRRDSPFSQHHPSKFKVDDIDYVNAEQYMMHQKALLFGDDEIAKQILRESEPQVMKKLGRKVKGFDEERWKKNRESIVKKGSYAKFSQNPDLKRQLLDTDGTILVEASPRDCIWGIGLGKDNPKAKTKSTWRGRNLLGQILTDVREELKKE